MNGEAFFSRFTKSMNLNNSLNESPFVVSYTSDQPSSHPLSSNPPVSDLPPNQSVSISSVSNDSSNQSTSNLPPSNQSPIQLPWKSPVSNESLNQPLNPIVSGQSLNVPPTNQSLNQFAFNFPAPNQSTIQSALNLPVSNESQSKSPPLNHPLNPLVKEQSLIPPVSDQPSNPPALNQSLNPLVSNQSLNPLVSNQSLNPLVSNQSLNPPHSNQPSNQSSKKSSQNRSPSNQSTSKPLHITQYREKIVSTISENLTVIIKGQTGCGKTTQVPQYILDDCNLKNIHCNIICTQPRRIAAISIAKRVCQERNWQLGKEVGYQVGYDANASKDTRLLFCTAGILMQTLISTRDLSIYTHIIVDEVHERNKETDFLLMILKMLIAQNNNETKLILMSASIAANNFAEYFATRSQWSVVVPPVIDVTQETKFPVKIFHLDDIKKIISSHKILIDKKYPSVSTGAYEVALEIINHLTHEEANLAVLGAVLVFLPGINEIESFYELLDTYKEKNKITNEEWVICPLHSQVSHEEQIIAFKEVPQKTRKIVIATNVAESSITIPDIKYVIDFCLKKVVMQKKGTGHNSLELSWIAKSNGQQRAGRVGRTMPGVVYRLVHRFFYENLPDYPIPEMVCCTLDELVLQAKRLNMGSPSEILSKALDPPDNDHICQTVLKLKEVGALYFTANGEYKIDDGDMTYLGSIMANLPIEIHLSKLIILGYIFGYLDEAILMACSISVKNMFSSPFKKKLDAYNRKRIWADSCESDPITFLRVYYTYMQRSEIPELRDLSSKNWEKQCFVQIKALNEIIQVYKDIIARLKICNIEVPKSEKKDFSEEDLIMLKFILAGSAFPNLYSNCRTDEKNAVSKLGGRDPLKTVYFTEFPAEQPVPLYIPRIHAYFAQLEYGLRIEFDELRNVFIMFDDYLEDHEKVKRAVYSAVKMRNIVRKFRLNSLHSVKAKQRLFEVTGKNSFPMNQPIEQYPTRKPEPETFGMSPLEITISNVVNPRLFYGRLLLEEAKYNTINQQLANLKHTPVKANDLMQGQIRIAVMKLKERTVYIRVKILWFDAKKQNIKVFAIDIGSTYYFDIRNIHEIIDATKRDIMYKEPGLAIEFSLAEIEPKHINGSWSPESVNEFINLFQDDPKAIAKVYSVVDGKVFVYLFKHTTNIEKLTNFHSINQFFIHKSLAVNAVESRLSQMNHKAREIKSHVYSNSSTAPQFKMSSPENCLMNRKFNSPEERECGKKSFNLNGPYSPLEVRLEPLVKKLLGFPAQIEFQSVNSVLLDQNPEKPHTQITAASSVSWAKRGKKDVLVLKNTTVLPCFPGIDAIVLLTFAARNELKTNAGKISGVLCGLGMNLETRQSLNGDHDIEISFTAAMDKDDIDKINEIRMFMNCFGNDFIAKTQVETVQKNLQKLTLDLIRKERAHKESSFFIRTHKWLKDLPYESYCTPEGTDLNMRCIFPQIEYQC